MVKLTQVAGQRKIKFFSLVALIGLPFFPGSIVRHFPGYDVHNIMQANCCSAMHVFHTE